MQAWAEIVAGRAAAARLSSGRKFALSTQSTLKKQRRLGRRAEERLLSATLGLVRKRVRDLGFSFEADELEGAAIEGLVEAMRRFDPSRGARFATYANSWITKMVMASIAKRYPVPDDDLRLVVAYRRYARKGDGRRPKLADVAATLEVSRSEASRIAALSDHLSAGMVSFEASPHRVQNLSMRDPDPVDAEWIIDTLRRILDADFRDFWMVVGQVCSLEELAAEHGISKQAMWKRKQRWLEKVRQSPEAEPLLRWLDAQ